MSTPSNEPPPEFRRPVHLGDSYETTPPWDIGRPQTAFATLAEEGGLHGRVLDIGCGTGEHALMAARVGLDAVGIDQSPLAIETAERKARERGLKVRFLCYDALMLADLGETFDTVLDCGLFHTFDPEIRGAFAESVASVVRPGGRYFLLGFSDRQPGTWGPYRLSRTDIESAFTDGWHIDSFTEAVIDILIEPNTIQAWLVTITRL
ncbi:class I SAM-dependent methyltransferase [Nocardia sp.]|uniref:class I SAM-dependent methyltransferase n=1 Tax=Nocardia sp. TaxID=1821 RepID=UPI002618D210|nr:class I SAM-dependent methyltransferase [Nocardia sp.]